MINEREGLFFVELCPRGDDWKAAQDAGFIYHDHPSPRVCEACKAGIGRSTRNWRRWWTPYPEKALALARKPGWECRAKTMTAIETGLARAQERKEAREREQHDRQPVIAASRAVEPATTPDIPAMADLLPHQLAGVEFGRDKRVVLLADEAGLGKRSQAIAIVLATGIRPADTVVITDDVKRWTDAKETLAPALTLMSFRQVSSGLIQDKTWKAVIVDDVSFLGDGRTKRTAAILGDATKPGVATMATRSCSSCARGRR